MTCSSVFRWRCKSLFVSCLTLLLISTQTGWTMADENNSKGRIQKWMDRVLYRKQASTSTTSTTTTSSNTETKEKPTKKRQLLTRPFEAFRLYNKQDSVSTARVVSGSFHLISTSAGFVADSVRTSGDTAGAFLGSSVKIMGTATKGIAKGVVAASKFIDTKKERAMAQDIPTEPNTLPATPPPKKRAFQFTKRSRQTAAKSARFLATAIDSVGEGFLIAGAAAESLASSTAGVAEETVRILEDLAGTLSVAISFRAQKRQKYRMANSNQTATNSRIPTPPYLSFGMYPDPTQEEPRPTGSSEDIRMLFEFLAMDAQQLRRSLSAELEGVPSIAGELATVLFLGYLLALLLLHKRDQKDSKDELAREKSTPLQRLKTLLSERVNKSRKAIQNPNLSSISQLCLRGVKQGSYFFCVALPCKNVRYFSKCALGFLFSRKMVLLCVYGLFWVYLSRLSQERVTIVHRRAEAVGFRNALATVSANSPPTETVLWLNYALSRTWHINYTDSSDDPFDYPPFVAKALANNTQGHYGGLEPFLSSVIGAGMVKGLELAKKKRPTDIAYASLVSLSLGSRPPVVRSVKQSNEIVKDDYTQIELDLEVDALLEDLSMVFKVKLSSLSYALLPSTKVEVFSLDFRAALKVILVLTPQKPFVSQVQVSMSRQPHCDFRVRPVSKDSGPSGIDLGSIPFLNDWLQEAVRVTLSSYVSPKYISIDVGDFLNREKPDSVSSWPSINNLRHKTRSPVSSPRTSTPRAIAIISVADQLESRHVSLEAIGSEMIPFPTAEAISRLEILKPVTELARLGMDRNELLKDNLLRPITELSKLGMDRWLNSTIMMRSRNRMSEIGDGTPRSESHSDFDLSGGIYAPNG